MNIDRFKYRVYIPEINNYIYPLEDQKEDLADLPHEELWDSPEQLVADIHSKIEELQSNKRKVEQCTGLRDAANQLIYEGDIVKIIPEDDEVGIIRWNNNTARFIIDNIWDKVEYDFDNWESTKLEVVNNINQDDYFK